jgi:L-lysine exporter family protein LysE/ArgO
MIENASANLLAFGTGFAIGAGLIIAIGAQNAFVLRQGLLKQHVLPIVLFCAVSDALLIIAGVAGLGTMISQSPLALKFVALVGAAFLGWYGWVAFRRAQQPQSLDVSAEGGLSLRQALLMCATFTWANPHVYLDTVLLVGSLSAPYADVQRVAYGLGAASSSFAWFFALGFGARLLRPLFAKPVTWKILDYGIAAVMWAIAATLLRDVIR